MLLLLFVLAWKLVMAEMFEGEPLLLYEAVL